MTDSVTGRCIEDTLYCVLCMWHVLIQMLYQCAQIISEFIHQMMLELVCRELFCQMSVTRLFEYLRDKIMYKSCNS